MGIKSSLFGFNEVIQFHANHLSSKYPTIFILQCKLCTTLLFFLSLCQKSYFPSFILRFFPPLPFCFCFSSVSITKSSAKIQSSPSKVTRRSMQSPQKSAPVPAQRGRKPGRGKPPGQSAVPKKGRSPKNIPLTKSTSHTENLKTRKKSLKPGKKVSPYLLLYFILQNFVVRFF